MAYRDDSGSHEGGAVTEIMRIFSRTPESALAKLFDAMRTPEKGGSTLTMLLGRAGHEAFCAALAKAGMDETDKHKRSSNQYTLRQNLLNNDYWDEHVVIVRALATETDPAERAQNNEVLRKRLGVFNHRNVYVAIAETLWNETDVVERRKNMDSMRQYFLSATFEFLSFLGYQLSLETDPAEQIKNRETMQERLRRNPDASIDSIFEKKQIAEWLQKLEPAPATGTSPACAR
jgi:hypothetical protein